MSLLAGFSALTHDILIITEMMVAPNQMVIQIK